MKKTNTTVFTDTNVVSNVEKKVKLPKMIPIKVTLCEPCSRYCYNDNHIGTGIPLVVKNGKALVLSVIFDSFRFPSVIIHTDDAPDSG